MENSKLELTDAQQEHVKFMSLILRELQDRPMILKGGTALMLGYGLDRFSEDIDLDAKKSFSLESSIKKACDRSADFKLLDIKIRKDTETVKRYMVGYECKTGIERLKIESSLRDNANTDNAKIVNGIRIYDVNTLIDLKLDAAFGRAKARDLYDLNFLVNTQGQAFTDKQINRLEALGDTNALYSKYQADYETDKLLSHKPLEALVLGVEQGVIQLKKNDSLNNKPISDRPKAQYSPTHKKGFGL